MATLEDLYRARAGDDREQREDFLSAALALVLQHCPEVRGPLLELWGVTLPDGADLAVGCQEDLYERKDGTHIGRADLVLRWNEGGSRTLIVEAKVDAPLTREQPKKYRKALPPDRKRDVVALTWHDKDAEVWQPHASWAAVLKVVGEARGSLVEAFASHLRTQGLELSPRLERPDLERHQDALARLDAIDRAFGDLLPQLVPSQHRGELLARSRAGEAEEHLGWEATWPRRRKQDGPLAYTGLSMNADRNDVGGLKFELWLRPRRQKIRAALIKHGPWTRDGEWLGAGLGTFTAEEPLDDAMVEAAERARRWLTRPSEKKLAGLWAKRTRAAERSRSELTRPETRLSVGEAAALSRSCAAVSEAAESLQGHWLAAVREELEAAREGCCKRSTSHHDGSFSARNGRGMVHVAVRPSEPSRLLGGWVWAGGKERVAALRKALDELGWAHRPDAEDSGSTRFDVRLSPTADIDVETVRTAARQLTGCLLPIWS